MTVHSKIPTETIAPPDRQLIEETRREVADLRQRVAELETLVVFRNEPVATVKILTKMRARIIDAIRRRAAETASKEFDWIAKKLAR